MKRLLLSFIFIVAAITTNAQDFYFTGFKTVGASQNVDFTINNGPQTGGLGDFTNTQEIIINPQTVDPDSIQFSATFNKDARIKMWIDLSSISLPWLQIVDSKDSVSSPYVGTSEFLSMLGQIPEPDEGETYNFTFRIGGAADNSFPEDEGWQPEADPSESEWEFIDIALTIDYAYDMSVEKQDFKDFGFYPNPVKSNLNLKAAQNIENVEVFDLLGKRVKAETPNDLTSQLDLQDLQSGVYIMKVTINGQQNNYKIIKQ